MKDFLGQTILVGDEIVYPNRQSSSLWMNRARVTSVKEDGLQIRRDDGVVKTIKRVDRVVVVTRQIEEANAIV
jgi:hypothetical protein